MENQPEYNTGMFYESSPILAQDAFDKSMKVMDGIDVEEQMKLIYQSIRVTAALGGLVSNCGPWSNPLMAEKIALILETKGFHATTIQFGPGIGVNINWKFIPQSVRERLVN